MEVAVFVYGHGLFVGEGKLCYGSFAGQQLLIQSALGGFKADPLYAVLFQHGVCYGANFYLYLVAQDGNYGEVFLLACFYGICDQLFHLFAAAYKGNAGVVDGGYDIAAVLADIKLNISHFDFSFFKQIIFSLFAVSSARLFFIC